MSRALQADASVSNGALIRRLLALSWRYRRGCVKVLVLQALVQLLGLAGLGFTGLGVDEMRYAMGASQNPPRWPLHFSLPQNWSPMQIIAAIAGAVIFSAALRGVLDYFNRVEANDLVQAQLVVHLRAEVYNKLQRLSFRFFDENASSSIINRVTSDVQSVRMFLDQVLIQSIILALSLGLYLAYMLSIHVRLTLACLASTPLLWLVSQIFSRLVQPAYQRNRDLVDSMMQRLSENIRGMQVVRAFARERDEVEKFRRANETVRAQKRGMFRQISCFVPLIGFLSQINLIVLLGYGGFLVIENRIPLGAGLIAFAGILQQFSSQIANIANIANSMQESLAGARRVFEVLDAKVEIVNHSAPLQLSRVRGRVTFENVRVKNGGEKPVLDAVSFEVQPGQCVAIAGPTGSGKSTLLNLIPRFFDPTNGRVLIDGVDLRELEISAARKNVGIVFQDNFLFSTSVAANIAFGSPRATREQIEKAARIAAAHHFIEKMPRGYDTILGEGGSGLSGGQRQRLAIARALLLDPAILLLDDPTAAIDSQTEHEIVAAIGAAMANRTTFIVAHRMSTLQRADVIVVLDRGRIAQIGTHADLLRAPGYYARAAQIQIAPEDLASISDEAEEISETAQTNEFAAA